MRDAKDITKLKIRLTDKKNPVCPIDGVWITENNELFLKVETTPGITVNYKIGAFNSEFLKIEK